MTDTDATRRGLMGAATLGTLMLGAFAGHTQAAEWTAQEAANVKLVNEFMHATAPKEMTKAVSYLSADCVYRMTETTPPDKGHEAIIKRLAPFVDNADKITFEIYSTHALGPIVINHRLDTFTSKTRPLIFEGVGVFFLKGGKIAEWTDYTIRAALSNTWPPAR